MIRAQILTIRYLLRIIRYLIRLIRNFLPESPKNSQKPRGSSRHPALLTAQSPGRP